MNDAAKDIKKRAIEALQRNVAASMKGKKHTIREAADLMEFHQTNTVFRMLNPDRTRPDPELRYIPIATIDVFAAGLEYCGLKFANLGGAIKQTGWEAVDLAIEALDIPKDYRLHIKHIMYQHYCFLMRELEREAELQQEHRTTEKSNGIQANA